MILGMSLSTFTLVHVQISLIGIASGLFVVYGFFARKAFNGWHALFLLTTVLTSVTGFFFPFHKLTPGIKVGIISLVLLAIALLARYSFHLAGVWNRTYIVSAMMALYLNCFVLTVQSFQKAPALHALAPTQTESPFLIAQLVVLAIFIGLTIGAVKRSKTAPASEGIRRQAA
ncbi:MAG: hypothetical protein WBV46_07720 [Terriglobales bacterium]